jgi:hypothetical protein
MTLTSIMPDASLGATVGQTGVWCVPFVNLCAIEVRIKLFASDCLLFNFGTFLLLCHVCFKIVWF